jgi:hypothetical protein
MIVSAVPGYEFPTVVDQRHRSVPFALARPLDDGILVAIYAWQIYPGITGP